MTVSLKDQLLALGFKKTEPDRPERKNDVRRGGGKPPPHGGAPRGDRKPGESRRDAKPHGGAERRHDGKPHGGKPPHGTQGRDHQPNPGRRDGKPRTQEEIDLAKAYALRAQTEKAERARLEREAQERAREKKERKAKLAALLEGKAQNAADADVPRHFPHGDKIRRVYVTAEQLQRLNRGELGVVQHLGRYLLVDGEVAKQAAAIAPEALVLLPDPNAPAEDDIPPDLVW